MWFLPALASPLRRIRRVRLTLSVAPGLDPGVHEAAKRVPTLPLFQEARHHGSPGLRPPKVEVARHLDGCYGPQAVKPGDDAAVWGEAIVLRALPATLTMRSVAMQWR